MKHKMRRQHRRAVESMVAFEVTEDRWGAKSVKASLEGVEEIVHGLQTDRCVVKAMEKAAVRVRKRVEELAA